MIGEKFNSDLQLHKRLGYMENNNEGKYRAKARKSSEKAHFKQAATKIIDGIDKLNGSEHKGKAVRRWVWELLQNAKDVACNNSVDIELEINNTCVRFKHSGAPFLMDNITYLIEQVSTKERGESIEEKIKIATTGKFGTGFMTTHLLSKIVKIKGIYKDNDVSPAVYQSFELILDRTPTGVTEMIKSIEEATDNVFTDIDNNAGNGFTDYQEGQKCDTIFEYQLNERGLEIAYKGIEDIHDNLPLTFSFVKELNKFTVIDNIKNTTTVYKRNKSNLVSEGIDEVVVEMVINNESPILYHFLLLEDKESYVQIAVEYEKTDDNFSLIPPRKNRPILHCVFPLIGSERFGLPMYINSPIFNPEEPRDGIRLSQEIDENLPEEKEDEKITENKKLIEIAVELYEKLSKFVLDKWENLYWLLDIESPKQAVDKKWYNEVKNKIKEFLIELPLVKTIQGGKITFRNAKIPYPAENAEQIWDFISFKYPNQFPPKEHVVFLSNIVKNSWGDSCRYKIVDLAKDVSDYKNVINLSYELEKNLVLTFNWLNSIINFISLNNKELFTEIEILPNQHLEFKSANYLNHDRGIPEELKFIYSQFSKTTKLNIKEVLIHKEVILGESIKLKGEFNVERLSKNIDYWLQNEDVRFDLNTGIGLLSEIVFNVSNESDIPLYIKQVFIGFYYQTLIQSRNNKYEWIVKSKINWSGFKWENIQNWMLKNISKKISGFRTIEAYNLNFNVKYLEVSECIEIKDKISTLVAYLNFVRENNFEEVAEYNSLRLFPAQNGHLRDLNSVFIDDKIPENLKVAYANLKGTLGTDFRYKLLCKSDDLLLPKDFKKLNTADISKGINIRIVEYSDLIEDENIEDKTLISEDILNKRSERDTKWLKGILIVLSGIKDNLDIQRNYLWTLAKQLYPEITSELQTFEVDIELAKNDLWTNVDKWFINKVLKEVEDCVSLENLSSRLSFSHTKDTIIWLDKFIGFIQNDIDLTLLLEKYRAIPNQHGILKIKSLIKIDEDIPETFKEILQILIRKDWKKELLYKEDKFSWGNTIKLFTEDEKIISAEKIAKEIDSTFRKIEDNGRDQDSFASALTLLISWIEENKEEPKYRDQIENWFSWVEKKKAQLMLDIFKDKRDAAFKMIRSDKFDELSKLADNDCISKEAINAMTKDPALFEKTAKEIKRKEEETEKQRKHEEQMTAYGNYAEEIFKSYFTVDMGFEVDPGGYGKDFVIRHNDSKMEYFIELKSKSIASFDQNVSLCYSQAHMACQYSDNFALCVIPIRGDLTCKSDLEQNAKFLTDIGELVEPNFFKAKYVFDNMKSIENNIEMTYIFPDITFEVSKKVWSNGNGLSEFIEKLNAYFGI
jgi:hypothetical protein